MMRGQMSQPYTVQQPETSGGLFADPRMQQFNRQGPQMSSPNVEQGRNMISQAPQQAPQQSFEQFQQTLGNNGMSSGAMHDAYQKSLQPQSINFGQNTGVGTQKPPGFNPDPAWGNQTYGFDPKAMAGKTVGQDMAWYYGQDSVGRPINNQGDAYSQFRSPADGYQRTNPWQK
jgi:hypothetical protein